MLGISEDSKLPTEQTASSNNIDELNKLISTTDWSKTPLGAFADWPENLKSTLRIALNCQYPIAIYWGHEGYLFYNDAWRPIVGNKHPWALGRPGREVWPEIWHLVGPLFENVFQTSKGSFQPDSLLPMERHGYKEECYFSYTFSPIIGEKGTVEGIFNVVTETTYRILNERRTRLLQEIAARATSGKSIAQVCKLIFEAIGNELTDIPFALLYLTEKEGKQARLQSSVGLKIEAKAAPETIDLTSASSSFQWPLNQVCRELKAVQVQDLTSRFGSLPGGTWTDEATHTAVILPLERGTNPPPGGFLIVGINPRRALDSAYQIFHELLASAVEAALSHARAYEEECRRAEALAEINRAKTIFFSNASHEFRTPLTLILGPLEDALAEKEPVLAPRQQERLMLVQRNALRLLKLVNTLLDFSRLEVGRMQATYEPFPLATLTSELVGVFRAAIEKAGLTLHVEMEAFDELVYIDKDMWEKIVCNLLSNALKYTLAGSIQVDFKKVKGAVEFSVTDTGVGIPEHELPHIFERFYRVETTESRSFEGTGIGLSLTEELVKLHGGTIRVVSKLGSGSVFTVTIPLGMAHLPAAQIKKVTSNSPLKPQSRTIRSAFLQEALRWLPEESKQEVTSLPVDEEGTKNKLRLPTEKEDLSDTKREMPDFKYSDSSSAENSDAKPLLLVVDDNADMRDYVRRLLTPNYRVLTAADGEAAVAAALKYKPQLILSDVMMPKLDGFGLIRRLRNETATRLLPIILLSARAGEEAQVEGLEQGADDYLVKPFAARELLARVKIHLELGQLRMHLQERGDKALARAEEAQRRRAEEAEKHSQLSEQFIDTMCHELRNPLNGIYGSVNLLQANAAELKATALTPPSELKTPEDWSKKILAHLEKDREALLAIDKCARYQKVITDDVLNLSRLDAGKVELNPIEFRPNKLLKDIIDMLETHIRHKRLKFQLHLLPRKLYIKADSNRLMQVLLNLLTNAIKFTPEEGEIIIRLAQLKNVTPHLLQISVADNGIGMTPEEQARLFERFSQANRKTASEYGGSGLGLTISKSLITLMGGGIAVESVKGRGTTFTFTMQYEPVSLHKEKQKSPLAARAPTAELRKGLRILIAEDNVINQKVLKRQLEQEGCTCYIANNGQEAVDWFQKVPLDLIFMDIEMPVLNGHEATKTIRRQEKEATRLKKALPIIGLSGNARPEHKTEALAAGMDDYLVKPYEKPKLLEIMARHIPPDSPALPSSPATVEEKRTSLGDSKALIEGASDKLALSLAASPSISSATSPPLNFSASASSDSETGLAFAGKEDHSLTSPKKVHDPEITPLQALNALIPFCQQQGNEELVKQLTLLHQNIQKTEQTQKFSLANHTEFFIKATYPTDTPTSVNLPPSVTLLPAVPVDSSTRIRKNPSA